jgi:hypothetical protein
MYNIILHFIFNLNGFIQISLINQKRLSQNKKGIEIFLRLPFRLFNFIG